MIDQDLLDKQQKRIEFAERVWAVTLILFAVSLLFVQYIGWWGAIIVAVVGIAVAVFVNAIVYRPAILAIASLEIDEWYSNAQKTMRTQLHFTHHDPEVMDMFCQRAEQYDMTCVGVAEVKSGALRSAIKRISVSE